MTDRNPKDTSNQDAAGVPDAELPATVRDGLPEALREALQERAETVPGDVAVRLAGMRRAAVQELDARDGTRRGRLLIGSLAGSAAALVLAVLLLVQLDGEPGSGSLLVDPEEMAAVEELEILEDLEFLAWLEEEVLDAAQG